MKDLYKILQVSRSATTIEIKVAFRNLAMKYHPDQNQNNKQKAEELFKELTHAYEVLTDTNKKAEYDRTIGNYTNDRFNRITRRTQTFKTNSHPVNSAHFNIDVWNAWHYGDNAISIPSVRRKDYWNDPNDPHQQYFRRRNSKEAKRRYNDEWRKYEQESDGNSSSANSRTANCSSGTNSDNTKAGPDKEPDLSRLSPHELNEYLRKSAADNLNSKRTQRRDSEKTSMSSSSNESCCVS